MYRFVAHFTQDTIPQAFFRDGSQLLLDVLDRLFKCTGRRKLDWEDTGKPADRTGQVYIVEQFFAAMAFKLDQGIVTPGPAADYPGQGCEQQVVDLRAVSRWGLLKQLARLGLAQSDLQVTAMAIVQAGVWMFAGQVSGNAVQLLLPVIDFLQQGTTLCIPPQALAPSFHRAGFVW